MSSKEDNVRVVIRCRPLLPDLEQREEVIIKVLDFFLFSFCKSSNIFLN